MMKAATNLHVIRCASAVSTHDRYEEITEVRILGDTEGYQYLASAVRDARKTSLPIRITVECPNSMRCLVLPPISSELAPLLKWIERVVGDRGRAEMELVIAGSHAGYVWLEGVFMRFASEALGTDHHEHFDDSCSEGDGCEIVPRSVQLTLHGAEKSWSIAALGCYGHLVTERKSSFLPDDVEYLSGAAYVIPEVTFAI